MLPDDLEKILKVNAQRCKDIIFFKARENPKEKGMANAAPIYVLLNAESLQVTFERKKPRGEIHRPYTSRILGVKLILSYGLPVVKVEDFFQKPSEGRCVGAEPDHRFPPVPECRNVSILKSTLQKCVRRGYVKEALRCAKSLMALNFASFCRRMVVIAAEDVFFGKDCLTLIWMYKMSRSGRYVPSTRHINHLLGYVKILCEEKRYVLYGSEESFVEHLGEQNHRERCAQAMLRMFIHEAALMAWDEKMLKWYHNHLQELADDTKAIKVVDESTVRYMTWDDLPLVGIDFHTHAGLARMVASKLKDGVSEERIRSIIWNARSSVNYRKMSREDISMIKDYDKMGSIIEETCLYLRRQQERIENQMNHN